mgnify:CR=1 FL=1
MSIYGHLLLESTTDITKQECINILKNIGKIIEDYYNSNIKKINLHTVKGSISSYEDTDEEDNDVEIIEYNFTDYYDDDDDFEHSYCYYDSGNSGLSEEELKKFNYKYYDIIYTIYEKLEKIIKNYRSKGYDIQLDLGDNRGTQFIVYITISIEDPLKNSMKDIINKIVSNIKSNLSKFKPSDLENGEMATIYKNKSMHCEYFSCKLDKDKVYKNQTNFINSNKLIISNINSLYSKNKDVFDKLNLYYNIDINKYKDCIEFNIKFFHDYPSIYNNRKYQKIELPSFCINILLGEKFKQKIEPYKNKFAKLVSEKIKDELNISLNANEYFGYLGYNTDKNIFIINYAFTQYEKFPVDCGVKSFPIFINIKRNSDIKKAREDLKKIKQIVKDASNELSDNNVKISNSWYYNGSMNYPLFVSISFKIKYSDSEINI